MSCHGDEVGEGVLLLQHPPVLVPRPAQLTATAHVGDDEHHAAVQQRQSGYREVRILAGFVCAVAVQECRSRKLQSRTVNDRDRNAGTVGRLRPVAAFHVLLGAVVAKHRLFAQQRALARRQVDVVDAHRDHERGGAHPQPRRRPVGVGRQAARGQLRLERDVLGVPVIAVGVDRPQLDSGQRFASVADHDVVGERIDGVEPDVFAVRDERPKRGGVAHRSLDQGEVLGPVVVQDQESVLTADHHVMGRVLDEFAARQDRRERRLGFRGVAVEHLGGDRTSRRDEHVLVASRAADRDPESFVRFVIHLLVGQPGPDPVAPHGVGPPRVVDRDVVDSAVVGRPRDAGADARDRVVVQLARA